MSRIRRLSPVLAVMFVISLVVGCQEEPTRWDAAQQATQANQPAVAPEAAAGNEFNKFFPTVEAPFDLVFKQEKPGFAQASLKQDGKEVATLSISDTSSNPEAAAKYKDSTEAMAGYPVVAIGAKGTGLLVLNRYQVQIRSIDDSFTKEQRDEWLKKFDLDGLSKLQ